MPSTTSVAAAVTLIMIAAGAKGAPVAVEQLPGALSGAAASRSKCKTVSPASELNSTEYVRATWYIQQQQLTGYQAKEDLFCVAQTFDADTTEKVPFYDGQVIAVYNYANLNEVNGANVNDQNGTILCARQPDPEDDPARLINAPCFIPNILAGPYWVVAAGPQPTTDGSYVPMEWAIVSGGQPTVSYPDGGCTTKLTGTNGSGLWLFSRKPVADAETIKTMLSTLQSLGYTTKELLPVAQAGCRYDGANIKPDHRG